MGEDWYYDDRNIEPRRFHRPSRLKPRRRKSDGSGPDSRIVMCILGSAVVVFLLIFVGILFAGAGGAFTPAPRPPSNYPPPPPPRQQSGGMNPVAVGLLGCAAYGTTTGLAMGAMAAAMN